MLYISATVGCFLFDDYKALPLLILKYDIDSQSKCLILMSIIFKLKKLYMFSFFIT